MGMTFENLTWEDMCDLMCGAPEIDDDDDQSTIKKEEFENEKISEK